MSSTRSLPRGAGLLQNAPVRAVVIAEHLRPFQKFVARHHGFEFRPRDEMVAFAVLFLPARLAGGVRD